MLVDLVCVQGCFIDMSGGNKHRHIIQGQKIDEVEVDGSEGWLKFFNAYEPEQPIKPRKTIKRVLVEDIGKADEDAEKPLKTPSPQDLGAGPRPSLDVVKKAISKENMINMLKSDGLKLANDKWSEDTLAKHVIKRQLYVGNI